MTALQVLMFLQKLKTSFYGAVVQSVGDKELKILSVVDSSSPRPTKTVHGLRKVNDLQVSYKLSLTDILLEDVEYIDLAVSATTSSLEDG